jgi:hypothetical protein
LETLSAARGESLRACCTGTISSPRLDEVSVSKYGQVREKNLIRLIIAKGERRVGILDIEPKGAGNFDNMGISSPTPSGKNRDRRVGRTEESASRIGRNAD